MHLWPERQKASGTHVLSCKPIHASLLICHKGWSQKQLEPLESLLRGLDIHSIGSRGCLTLDVELRFLLGKWGGCQSPG